MNLFKSELRKVLYARSSYGLLAAAVGISVLSASVTPYAITMSSRILGGLNKSELVDTVYGKATGGYLFAVILGVILMAGEFKQGTAVATFLAAPKRSRVLLVKIAVAALCGFLLQLLAAGAGVVAAKIALSFYPEAAEPSGTVIINTLLAAVISGLVLAVVGVAVGTLIRNQTLATLAVVIWLNVVEPILILVFPDGAKFFATGCIGGILDLHVTVSKLNLSTNNYLDPLSAALLLLCYGVVFAGLAMVTTLRRDID